MKDHLESLEEKKKYAQSIIDSIGFVQNGILTRDFHAGAVLGIIVDVVVFAMTYAAVKGGKHADIYSKLAQELYSSVDNSRSIDVSRVNSDLNNLATFISNILPTKDEEILKKIAVFFFAIREVAIIPHPSYENCHHCGQQHDEYSTDGCPAYCDDDEKKENRKRENLIGVVGNDGKAFLQKLWNR